MSVHGMAMELMATHTRRVVFAVVMDPCPEAVALIDSERTPALKAVMDALGRLIEIDDKIDAAHEAARATSVESP